MNFEFSKNLIAAQKSSENIRKSVGYCKFIELMVFKTNYFIYRSNYIDFKRDLKEYYSDSNNLHNNTIKRWYRQKQIIKDVQNILFSARALTEKYESNYLNDPFYCFMKELRNFVVHVDFLPLSSRLIANKKKEKRFESIQLDKVQSYLTQQNQKFPQRKGTLLAMEYLENINGELNLNSLLENYHKKLDNFYTSYISKFLKSNLTELNQLVDSTKLVHEQLNKLGVKEDYPMTKARFRYLNYQLKSVEN